MQTLHNKIVTTAARSWGLQLSELLCASSGEGAAIPGFGGSTTRCGGQSHHEIRHEIHAQGRLASRAQAEEGVMA